MVRHWLNRTLCDVLEEMRKLNKTRNYSSLEGLIEEAQSMANRMEAKLTDIKDLNSYHDQISKATKKLNSLRKEISDLEGDKDES